MTITVRNINFEILKSKLGKASVTSPLSREHFLEQ